MTADPYDYRCPRCGTPMVNDATQCYRGEDCRTPLEAIRAAVASVCHVVLGACRWLGLVR